MFLVTPIINIRDDNISVIFTAVNGPKIWEKTQFFEFVHKHATQS